MLKGKFHSVSCTNAVTTAAKMGKSAFWPFILLLGQSLACKLRCQSQTMWVSLPTSARQRLWLTVHCVPLGHWSHLEQSLLSSQLCHCNCFWSCKVIQVWNLFQLKTVLFLLQCLFARWHHVAPLKVVSTRVSVQCKVAGRSRGCSCYCSGGRKVKSPDRVPKNYLPVN